MLHPHVGGFSVKFQFFTSFLRKEEEKNGFSLNCRQGGVLVTVCHLLALGINHWIGIARPLHYAATMTRRTAWIVILVSWSCPIIMLFIYYSSIPGKGFQSEGCEDSPFIKRKTYRIFFATCFFVPLFLLCLIYVHIFLIVRSHQSNRLRYQVKKKVNWIYDKIFLFVAST